jgi:hypothetical protein
VLADLRDERGGLVLLRLRRLGVGRDRVRALQRFAELALLHRLTDGASLAETASFGGSDSIPPVRGFAPFSAPSSKPLFRSPG